MREFASKRSHGVQRRAVAELLDYGRQSIRRLLVRCCVILLVGSLHPSYIITGTTNAFSFGGGTTTIQSKSVGRITRTSSLHGSTTSSQAVGYSPATLRAAVYQPPIPHPYLTKPPPTPDDDDNNTTNPLTFLTKITSILQLASKCQIDIVLFPELYLNGGLFEDVITGRAASAPLDRESSYALNIIGNLCGELSVACVIGYAEATHESEGRRQGVGGSGGGGGGSSRNNPPPVCYSSLAVFHADGSRAGNYRCVHPFGHRTTRPMGSSSLDDDASSDVGGIRRFEKGHALVEAMPISVRLPVRQAAAAAAPTIMETREVKLGVMCGGDLLLPEHARHLARSGAEILVVSASLSNDEDNDDDDEEPTTTTNRRNHPSDRVAKHVVPSRCMENELPLLFSNYVDEDQETNNEDYNNDEHNNNSATSIGTTAKKTSHCCCFVGQSAILSSDGTELVRAPERLTGDMPSDDGYFLPCDEMGGALYAADLELRANTVGSRSSSNNNNRSGSVGASMEQWNITPRIEDVGDEDKGGVVVAKEENKRGYSNVHGSKSKGFGRDAVNVLEQNKKRKLRLKNK